MKFLSSIRTLVLAAVLVAFSALRNAPAATLNLFPMADSYIRDTTPISNFGTSNPLLVGIAATGSPRQRCLFRFALDGVPAGAVVTGATLRLIAVAGPREPYTFDLNRVLVNWKEDETTWSVRLTGTPWSAAGGEMGTDFAASPSASAVFEPVSVPVSIGGQPVTNIFSSPAMVADVQSWLNEPGANFGWILYMAGGLAGSGRQLASREDVTLKPVLTVEYTASEPPAPSTPPVISNPVLEAEKIRFSFNAQSNRTYAIEFRDSLTTSNWTELQIIPAQPADTTLHVTNDVASPQGYFRVRTP